MPPCRILALAVATTVLACGQPASESQPREPESTVHAAATPVADLPPRPTEPEADAPELPGAPLPVEGDVVPPERLSGGSFRGLSSLCRPRGAIVLRLVIDPTGRVEEMTALRELPQCLDEPLRAALATWRFKPATLHGQPVRVYYNVTFHIRLQ